MSLRPHLIQSKKVKNRLNIQADACSVISKPSLLPLNLIFIKTKEKKNYLLSLNRIFCIERCVFFFRRPALLSTLLPMSFDLMLCFFPVAAVRWYDENVVNVCVCVCAHQPSYYICLAVDLAKALICISNCVDIPMNIEVFFFNCISFRITFAFVTINLQSIDVCRLFSLFQFGLIKNVQENAKKMKKEEQNKILRMQEKCKIRTHNEAKHFVHFHNNKVIVFHMKNLWCIYVGAIHLFWPWPNG